MPYGTGIPVKPLVMIVRLGCEKLELERLVPGENHAASVKHLLKSLGYSFCQEIVSEEALVGSSYLRAI